MVSVSKNQKFLISLIIVLIALGLALQKTKLYKVQQNVKIKTFNDEYSAEKYENAENFFKVKFEYQIDSITEFQEKFEKIANTHDLKVIFNRAKGNNLVYLAEFNKTEENEILRKLRKIGTVIEETKKTNGNDFNLENIDAHIKNNQLSIEQMQKQLKDGNLSPSYMSNIYKQIMNIQNKIDSLKEIPQKLEHNKTFELLYITGQKPQKQAKALNEKLIDFVIYFIISLLVIFAAAVILYFLIILIIKVMDLLGIKTKHKSSRYNRYEKKKKIVRRYKDKNNEKDKN